MTRRTWALALAAVALLLAALVGCGGDDASTAAGGDQAADGEAAAATVKKIAIATPEKGNDMGWNAQGIEAVRAIARERGLEIEVADGAGYDNVGPILSQLANADADLVIGHASGYNATQVDVATQTGVPQLVGDLPDGNEPGLINAYETLAEQGAYLAGYLAARTSRSGKLGIVTSADATNWNKQAGGFVAGARAADPDVEFLEAQIGQAGYADSAGGKRVTNAVIAGGADVVLGMGNGASFGMLQAVEQASDVLFIDVIGDKLSIDRKGVLLTSILWDFKPVFEEAVEALEAGRFGERVLEMTVANGGLRLLRTPQISDELWAEVEEVRERIAAGEIEVPLALTKADVTRLIRG